MNLEEKNVCSHYIWDVGRLPREVHMILRVCALTMRRYCPGSPVIPGRPRHDRASWPPRVATTRDLAFQRTSYSHHCLDDRPPKVRFFWIL